ncbi:hypothetical protein [Pseudomonas sp. zfem005]|uniref:hypothetical protein n=1 Tax=Pseudomonas sp. zfem005 TaxID=3078200 RepID=UPI002928FA90|nr:hypothetical protein [Pseudomonas sp. zfem005]MDU9412774.1 hypothetical protein [Pseudomonas sp. zfem005]
MNMECHASKAIRGISSFVAPDGPMHLRLQRTAVVLWLISLMLPATKTSNGEIVTGIEIFYSSLFFGVIGILAYPMHSLSAFSNFIFFREIGHTFSDQSKYREMTGVILVAAALFVNIYVTGHSMFALHKIGAGTLHYPAHYVWLTSFLVLFIARIQKSRFDRANS